VSSKGTDGGAGRNQAGTGAGEAPAIVVSGEAVLSVVVKITLALLVLMAYMASSANALELAVQAEDGRGFEADKVPLLFQQVEVDVHNQVAAAQHWFHFRSDLEEDVQIACGFALGPRELIDGFSYFNGDERIVGEVLENEAAQQVYQELTGIQQDPGILEQEGDRFRFRIYPVQPGENKPVEVRSIRVLETADGVLEWVLPKENLPPAGTVFSLRAEITDDVPIRSVETSGFLGVVTQLSPRHWRVEFDGEELSGDSDFRIRYRLDSARVGLRLTATRPDAGDGTFMLVVTPSDEVAPEQVPGRDIVFVIDISGSMSGEPLEQTKVALEYVIGQLHADDRFDVVAFDDIQVPVFGALKRADDSARDEAIQAVRRLQSRNGTNILGAVQAAMKELQPVIPGRPRAVVFLTDGQGNEPPGTVLAEVQRSDSGCRIFTFGVGVGVNRTFLERFARENRGISTLVQDPQRLDAEIRRLYDRISMPLMTDLDVDFGGLQVVDVHPERVPDLYRDAEVVLFGRYRQGGSGRITVKGTFGGRPHAVARDVALPSLDPGRSYLEKLWAARQIDRTNDRLQDSAPDGTPEAEALRSELVKEITRLGIVYNLVTDYTTFVAVPESLKTDDIKELMRKGQMGYDRKLIDSIEGIRLSMAAMPPGDPVLSVDAPVDARMVVAYFPFGLVKRLQYDSIRKHWSARFLVPRDVPDGLYEIRVNVVRRDGVSEWKSVSYYIDSTAPEFETEIPESAAAGCEIPIEVDPLEGVLEVYAYLPSSPGERVDLTLNPDTGTWFGRVQMPEHFPEGPVTVRIVVRDLARNRFEQDFAIWEGEDL
jgi:Ca-activated chloride channel family protein